MKRPGEGLPIAFLWPEIPQYAARMIGAAKRVLNSPIHVVSTHGTLPIAGIEELIGGPVIRVNPTANQVSWRQLGIDIPHTVLAGGWSTPAFNRLNADAREAGAKSVLLMDNPWKGTLRQWCGCLFFRLRKISRYDSIWVPGRHAGTFASRLGFSPGNIETGLYAVDQSLFSPGRPLSERPRRFLFVGQLIQRKGLHVLAQAMRTLAGQVPMDAFGSGPMKSELANVPGLRILSFVSGSQIAAEMARSQYLVLPSLEDHWPLVVLEAVASGCGVVTTDRVGNSGELLSHENSFIYPHMNAKELSRILLALSSSEADRLKKTRETSLAAAGKYSTDAWVGRLSRLIESLHQLPKKLR
jgi:glycosyltransferase involved in cell wall biosynthesis